MNRYVFIILLQVFLAPLFGQVNGVEFLAEWKEDDLLECKMWITSGSATSVMDRVSFNSQLTFVIPEDLDVEVESSIQPRELEGTDNTGDPVTWFLDNTSTLVNQEGSTAHSFRQDLLSGAYAYDELVLGDTVVLFTLRFSEKTTCLPGIRFFDSQEDEATEVNMENIMFIGSISPTVLIEQEIPINKILTIDGPTELCIGETLTASDLSSGVWLSTDPSVCSISNSGIITAVGVGVTQFVFQNFVNLCETDPSNSVYVRSNDQLVEGLREICIGGSFSITNSESGNNFESSDPTVATVSSLGTVVGLSTGTAFISGSNLCGEFDEIEVFVGNSIDLDLDPITICENESQILETDYSGYWVSSDNSIVAFADGNTIIAKDAGIASITFESDVENCTVFNNTIEVEVLETPMISIEEYGPICTTDIPFSLIGIPAGGVFTGSSISNGGIFNSSAAGVGGHTIKYTFVGNNGCANTAVTNIEVIECNEPCETTPFSDWSYLKVGDLFIIDEVGAYTTTKNADNENDNLLVYDQVDGITDLIYNNSGSYNEWGGASVINEFHEYDAKYDIISLGGFMPTIFMFEQGTSEGSFFSVYGSASFFEYELKSRIQLCDDVDISSLVQNDFDQDGMIDLFFHCGGEDYNFIFVNEDLSVELKNIVVPSTCNFFVDCRFLNDPADIIFNDGLVLNNQGGRVFTQVDHPGISLDCGARYLCNGRLYGSDGVYDLIGNEQMVTVLCSDEFASINPPFLADITNLNSTDVLDVSDNSFAWYNPDSECLESQSAEGTVNNVIVSESSKVRLLYNGAHSFIELVGDEVYAWVNPSQMGRVEGTAFIDENANGVFDDDESPLRNVAISNRFGFDFLVLTDENGHYSLPRYLQANQIRATISEGNWESEILLSNTLENIDCVKEINFAFVPDISGETGMYLSVSNTITRCDMNADFTFTIENVGVVDIENATLNFSFPADVLFVSSELPKSDMQTGEIAFELASIEPFVPLQFKMTLLMPSVENGLPDLDFNARIVDTEEELLDVYIYKERLRCSYDPNDKRTNPNRGSKNLTLMDEELEYTIRFQNNGNDTAFRVNIVDTLDQNIDPRSVRVISSSHPVTTCIMGNHLDFEFPDIRLVDSMTNYPSSQGYVSFRCKTKDNLAENTEVYNKASIYFDSNPPIVTNTSLNTLVSVLCDVVETNIDTFLCSGESFLEYDETGIYTETYDASSGCDSIVTIKLVIADFEESTSTVSFCAGGSVIHPSTGEIISTGTTLIDSLMDDGGCLVSVEITDYEVFDLLTSTIDTTICAGGDVEGHVVTGTYEDVYQSSEGCDSIVILNLTVQATEVTIRTEVFCEGEFVVHPSTGEIIIASTTVLDSTYDATGCLTDLVQTDYELIEVINITLDTTICDGHMVEGYSETGIYVVEGIDPITGCFVITTLDLKVLPLSDPLCTVATKDEIAYSVKIFPNPASNNIIIESEHPFRKINIKNLNGQLMQSKFINNYSEVKMDVSSLISGVYLVEIRYDEGVIVKKLMIF